MQLPRPASNCCVSSACISYPPTYRRNLHLTRNMCCFVPRLTSDSVVDARMRQELDLVPPSRDLLRRRCRGAGRGICRVVAAAAGSGQEVHICGRWLARGPKETKLVHMEPTSCDVICSNRVEIPVCTGSKPVARYIGFRTYFLTTSGTGSIRHRVLAATIGPDAPVRGAAPQRRGAAGAGAAGLRAVHGHGVFPPRHPRGARTGCRRQGSATASALCVSVGAECAIIIFCW